VSGQEPGRVRLRRSRGDLIRVEVDGRDLCLASPATVARFGLVDGGRLRPERVGELLAAAGYDRAWSRALTLLSYRPRSRREMELRLRRAGAPDGAIARVLANLERLGLLDDAAFADAWARYRLSRAGASRLALAGELRSRGVPAPVAAATVDRHLPPELEREEALRLATARAPHYRRLSPDVTARRLFALLLRRGFGREAALYAVRRVSGLSDIAE